MGFQEEGEAWFEKGTPGGRVHRTGCGGVGRSAWLVPKRSSVPGPPAVCNNLLMEWVNLWKKEEAGRTFPPSRTGAEHTGALEE